MKTAEDWYQEGLRALELSASADSTREYREDRESALEAFTQAVALGHPQAQRQRAMLLASLGHPEEALDSLVVVAAESPRDSEVVLESARALAKLERWAEAVPVFRQALKLNAELADAAYGLADALFRLKRDDEALAAWDHALQPKFQNKAFFFTRTWARVCRARTLARLQHPDAASAFRELLADDTSIGPMSDTSFWDALREAPIAQQVYRDWLAERPGDARAWRIAAERFSAAGCIEDALRAWDRVIELAPHDFFAWFGKAEAFAKAKQYDEAIDAFQRSLALKPDFLGAKARLEVVRAEAKRVSE